MRKRRYSIGLMSLLGASLLMLLVARPSGHMQAAEGDTGAPLPRALVVTDTGQYEGIVAKMQIHDWTVETVATLELDLLAASEGGLSDYNVVWVPAQENYPALRILAGDDGPLDQFARAGGVVVIMGVTPTKMWLDIAPGGLDALPLPSGGAGAVVIAEGTHPMISGMDTGGTPLASSDLDPNGTGGRGNLFNPPDGSDAVVIATNSAGCCVVDYRHGEGHCFVSTLLQEADPCKANVLLYVQSIAR
jgi:hypothetical protein